jgi:hypothetical protein
MLTPTNDKVKEATLKWCNEHRNRKGMEPLTELPKGKQADEFSCPCGKATNMSVAISAYDVSEDGKSIFGTQYPIPNKVNHFITRFDNGDIPELIEEQT